MLYLITYLVLSNLFGWKASLVQFSWYVPAIGCIRNCVDRSKRGKWELESVILILLPLWNCLKITWSHVFKFNNDSEIPSTQLSNCLQTHTLFFISLLFFFSMSKRNAIRTVQRSNTWTTIQSNLILSLERGGSWSKVKQFRLGNESNRLTDLPEKDSKKNTLLHIQWSAYSLCLSLSLLDAVFFSVLDQRSTHVLIESRACLCECVYI